MYNAGAGQDVVCAGNPVTVRWETNSKDLGIARQWDFMAIHPAGTAPGKSDYLCEILVKSNSYASIFAGEYQSSLYMFGVERGEIQFCAPWQPGRYTMSAVRDMDVLWTMWRC